MQDLGNQIIAPPDQRIVPVNALNVSTARLLDPRSMSQLPSESINPIGIQQQPNRNGPSSGTKIPIPNNFAFTF